jgi:predicted nucleic-acid-binding Zn-ribbon protein
MAETCARCGSTDVVWVKEIRTYKDLVYSTVLCLSPGVRKDEGVFGAKICRACGFTDFYLRDLDYLRSPRGLPPGVQLANPPPYIAPNPWGSPPIPAVAPPARPMAAPPPGYLSVPPPRYPAAPPPGPSPVPSVPLAFSGASAAPLPASGPAPAASPAPTVVPAEGGVGPSASVAPVAADPASASLALPPAKDAAPEPSESAAEPGEGSQGSASSSPATGRRRKTPRRRPSKSEEDES